MKDAGFAGVFCNIGDYPVPDWEAIIRPRAAQQGMFCGPWARTAKGDPNNPQFDPAKLDMIIGVADQWDSPLIVNSEKELDGSGSTLTTLIRDKVGGRDAALSMETWPFDSVSWTPLANMPVLPQIFSAEAGYFDPVSVRDQWWAYGVKCVYPTFGAYGGSTPATYPLKAPYSLFTGDDMGQNYSVWSPTSTGYIGCRTGPIPPDPGGEMAGVASSAIAAWEQWTKSDSKRTAWERDNPGEWSKLQSYWTAPAGTAPPTGISSPTGKMLLQIIETKRYGDGTHS